MNDLRLSLCSLSFAMQAVLAELLDLGISGCSVWNIGTVNLASASIGLISNTASRIPAACRQLARHCYCCWNSSLQTELNECLALALATHGKHCMQDSVICYRVSGNSPEASRQNGRMAKHFCLTVYGLAEGVLACSHQGQSIHIIKTAGSTSIIHPPRCQTCGREAVIERSAGPANASGGEG